jgi:hypothetical protein
MKKQFHVVIHEIQVGEHVDYTFGFGWTYLHKNIALWIIFLFRMPSKIGMTTRSNI